MQESLHASGHGKWIGRDTPFNGISPPPDREALETIPVLRKAISATRALAELKGKCRTLPHPELLLNSVALQESKDSSAIENIVTTNDQLYQAILNPIEQASPEVKEVLRYREAIHAGLVAMQRTQSLTTATALSVMQRIRNTTAGIRDKPGTALTNPATKKIIYTPPDIEHVRKRMDEWERFVNADDGLDPLVRMAAMHYQFEAIHPFSDGNGRTGRILNVLYLVQAGLLEQPILYHSSHILQHKSDYYRCLREVTETGQWEPWLLFMLDAIEQTSHTTLKLIESILQLRDITTEAIRGISQKMPVGELAELLFTYPYLKISTLQERGLGSRPTATKYLRALSSDKLGILHETRIGHEVYFINHRLMDLLTRHDR